LPVQLVSKISNLCDHNWWARTRGAQLSSGYAVNTYWKSHLYDASKLLAK